jgi:transcriptional regulator with XRE-family HTH domain
VDAASLIRFARREAGLTQTDVARQAHTSQSAIAAYETGARKPSLDTVARLLRACDHELELVARPVTRRGAASLAELVPQITDDLGAGEEQAALRLLFGFADDFRGSSGPGRRALIAEPPPPTGDARFDAALAGSAEFFAAEARMWPPSWVQAGERFVEPWWFVASRTEFHAYTLARTPATFARHGVFIAGEVFDRV